MKFIQRRSLNIGTSNSGDFICPGCNSMNSTTIHVYRDHISVLGIPFFPLGKKARTYCSSCMLTMTDVQIPVALKKKFRLSFLTYKGPIYQYTGLIAVTILIGFGLFIADLDRCGIGAESV